MSLDGISEGGRFCVLAIDHRDSLRAFLSPDDFDAVSDAELTQLKIDPDVETIDTIASQSTIETIDIFLTTNQQIAQVIAVHIRDEGEGESKNAELLGERGI